MIRLLQQLDLLFFLLKNIHLSPDLVWPSREKEYMNCWLKLGIYLTNGLLGNLV